MIGSKMKKTINRKQIMFYAWAGLAFLCIWMFSVLLKYPDEFFMRSTNYLWNIAYLVVFNFILWEYTIPSFRLNLKRIFLGILFIWLHIMFFSYGLYGWRAIGIALHIYTPLKEFKSVEEAVAYHMGLSMASVLFIGIIRHIYNYVKLKQSTQKLLIEKQQAELNYLKSQTNPHFLFNTLNNIYSLARDKSDLAPESILRLSKILRFMLYETSGAYIAIEQELKIMADYIELEKLRYDDSLQINFSHNVEDMKQSLPPLLLIPLVENAFKHGVSETRDRPFVHIHLSVNERRLQFVVKNSVEQFSGERTVIENIGLSNLRRQLELLYNEFSLVVEQDDDAFTSTLKINLASHV
jgi:two-component system LytT family sensor kinase